MAQGPRKATAESMSRVDEMEQCSRVGSLISQSGELGKIPRLSRQNSVPASTIGIGDDLPVWSGQQFETRLEKVPKRRGKITAPPRQGLGTAAHAEAVDSTRAVGMHDVRMMPADRTTRCSARCSFPRRTRAVSLARRLSIPGPRRCICKVAVATAVIGDASRALSARRRSAA